MTGKKHTPETIQRCRDASAATWASRTTEEREALLKKQLERKYAVHGAISFPRKGVTWKGGWREIGGKRGYYRSRWEANYARYLEFLKTHGEIVEWEHESKVFWFEGIKRGVMSYLPDFRVVLKNDKEEFHEVKGWMDTRSKTKIKRMRIYHPEVKLLVIDAAWFKSMKAWQSLIPGWEVPE